MGPARVVSQPVGLVTALGEQRLDLGLCRLGHRCSYIQVSRERTASFNEVSSPSRRPLLSIVLKNAEIEICFVSKKKD